MKHLYMSEIVIVIIYRGDPPCNSMAVMSDRSDKAASAGWIISWAAHGILLGGNKLDILYGMHVSWHVESYYVSQGGTPGVGLYTCNYYY
jgi:hypothetical protein